MILPYRVIIKDELEQTRTSNIERPTFFRKASTAPRRKYNLALMAQYPIPFEQYFRIQQSHFRIQSPLPYISAFPPGRRRRPLWAGGRIPTSLRRVGPDVPYGFRLVEPTARRGRRPHSIPPFHLFSYYFSLIF